VWFNLTPILSTFSLASTEHFLAGFFSWSHPVYLTWSSWMPLVPGMHSRKIYDKI
jgi:hypothetical protein